MALFRSHLGEHAGDWRVESAGTWTRDGEPAASKLISLLAEHGLDLRQHRSRGITRDLMHTFNVILTMERGHKEALQVEFPERAARVFLLTEMIGQIYDIQDPIGGSMADFRDTFDEVQFILKNGFDRIQELAREKGSRANRS